MKWVEAVVEAFCKVTHLHVEVEKQQGLRRHIRTQWCGQQRYANGFETRPLGIDAQALPDATCARMSVSLFLTCIRLLDFFDTLYIEQRPAMHASAGAETFCADATAKTSIFPPIDAQVGRFGIFGAGSAPSGWYLSSHEEPVCFSFAKMQT